ncbi:uncharacterized protein METZ01_LOCUS398068, partial [marine metagenome]
VPSALRTNCLLAFIGKYSSLILFDPEVFHTGNYTKVTQEFYKQKRPREE